MVLEQRIQDMEEEVNLLKAEVRATLVDIREHLLNTDINAVLGTARFPTVVQSRSIDNNERDTEEGIVNGRGDEGYVEGPASAQLRSHEKRQHHDAQDTVDPNLMASLLRWVVLTRKHIVHEELDAFMEICSLSGGLPEGIQQLVCRIAKTVRDVAIIDETSYSKWSDLMLQLHGIISPACLFSESERNATKA